MEALDVICGGTWGERYGVCRRYWTTKIPNDTPPIAKMQSRKWTGITFPWKEFGPDCTHEVPEERIKPRWILWCEKLKNDSSQVSIITILLDEPTFIRDVENIVHVL
jgi:hypothetical protein